MCLCELYSGICLTTEEKAWKNLSQGSRRVPVGTMKTEYTEQNVKCVTKTKSHSVRVLAAVEGMQNCKVLHLCTLQTGKCLATVRDYSLLAFKCRVKC